MEIFKLNSQKRDSELEAKLEPMGIYGRDLEKEGLYPVSNRTFYLMDIDEIASYFNSIKDYETAELIQKYEKLSYLKAEWHGMTKGKFAFSVELTHSLDLNCEFEKKSDAQRGKKWIENFKKEMVKYGYGADLKEIRLKKAFKGKALYHGMVEWFSKIELEYKETQTLLEEKLLKMYVETQKQVKQQAK